MAEKRRLVKYAGNIKKTVSSIIDLKVKDPEKGFVTITSVKVSPDLRIASIYYTVLGDDEQKVKTKKALDRSTGFIRNELKPSIKSRWLPELRFFYDETLDQAYKINKLINKIHNDSGPEE
jgi:ribosome-binding factor A